MSPAGRGSTHRGLPAAVPAGKYGPADPAPLAPGRLADDVEDLVVDFHGEDGRSKAFNVGSLPLPEWHVELAQAWACRVGPAGGLRTLASAEGSWGALGRLMRFLSLRARPPATPRQLVAADLQAFHRHLQGRRTSNVWPEIQLIALIFSCPPLRDSLPQETLDFLWQRAPAARSTGEPGYSEGEFRRLVTAVRADVANIRNRIRAGERLLDRLVTEPGKLNPHELILARHLEKIAATGEVHLAAGSHKLKGRTELAGHLFVTRQDLLPLMLLQVAVTGLNAESIKELSAEHRVLEEQAVEVRLIKRRGGERHWHRTVTWEIGPPDRELHTPGGLYLLLIRLMTRSRAVSGSPSLWSVWRDGAREHRYGAAEHYNPFASRLGTKIPKPSRW